MENSKEFKENIVPLVDGEGKNGIIVSWNEITGEFSFTDGNGDQVSGKNKKQYIKRAERLLQTKMKEREGRKLAEVQADQEREENEKRREMKEIERLKTQVVSRVAQRASRNVEAVNSKKIYYQTGSSKDDLMKLIEKKLQECLADETSETQSRIPEEWAKLRNLEKIVPQLFDRLEKELFEMMKNECKHFPYGEYNSFFYISGNKGEIVVSKNFVYSEAEKFLHHRVQEDFKTGNQALKRDDDSIDFQQNYESYYEEVYKRILHLLSKYGSTESKDLQSVIHTELHSRVMDTVVRMEE